MNRMSFAGIALAVALMACGSEPPALPEAVTELIVRDLEVGSGDEAVSGTALDVHYTGWLYDPAQPEGKGQKFDSSLDRDRTFGFTLGAKQVIDGWDQGVRGMKAGGKRRLIIPPELAYGDRSAGPIIKPGSTLLFDVELVRVSTPMQE